MDDRVVKPSAAFEHDFKVARLAAPLRHSVVDSIRNAIAVGRFKVGERLPERGLCEMTGVSRTLVREALRQLESEGLITVVPHRGPVVAGVTPEQAEGIYQVRAQLEGLACELFVAKATDAMRKALKDAYKQLKSAMMSNDPSIRVNAKNRFYQCLIEGAGNEALGQTLHLLNSRITVLRATSLQVPGRVKVSLRELNDLVEALMAGDGPAARAAAVHHVAMAAEAAIDILRREQAAGA
ncbi:GntR family transcriptional regulator [Aquabacter spiritensis]|uniref:GntR family transcriptional regulator n=1 Tax=Aquabacter spiritensis TaxID=933073 RepID=A0A4R3LUN5_9HYPH|nr:GntR family transcriptional regulator [Aquabacter spiritensis]TCT04231.1 GntR family transcriptional regulator [Aquabacter spiritensis]